MGDDFFMATVKNPKGEDVGSQESTLEGNTIYSVGIAIGLWNSTPKNSIFVCFFFHFYNTFLLYFESKLSVLVVLSFYLSKNEST